MEVLVGERGGASRNGGMRVVGGIPFETVVPATELKKKSFGALFDMARAQAAANGLTEDEVDDEIAACRRERRKRRLPSEKAGI